jgi:hypothetical protein
MHSRILIFLFAIIMAATWGTAPSIAQDKPAKAGSHEIVGVGHDARAEASLQPELLPSQYEPAHVEISQQW